MIGQPSAANSFRILVGIAMIIAALSTAYYFVITRPAFDRARLELEQAHLQDQQRREAMLSACLDEAKQTVWEFVKSNSTQQVGDQVGDTNKYLVPNEVQDSADRRLKALQSECELRYKIS